MALALQAPALSQIFLCELTAGFFKAVVLEQRAQPGHYSRFRLHTFEIFRITSNDKSQQLSPHPWPLPAARKIGKNIKTFDNLCALFSRLMGSLDQTIGCNMRRLREERDLTQQELAQAARCAQSTISGIERGTTKASRSLIERVAKAFDVPEWRIFLDRITAAELREFPEELRELARLARSPDPGLQKLAKRLIELVGVHLQLVRPRKLRQPKQRR